MNFCVYKSDVYMPCAMRVLRLQHIWILKIYLRGGASMCCCGQNIPIIGRLISVIYLAIATPDS